MPDLYSAGRQMPIAPEFIVELFPLQLRKTSNKRVFFHDHEAMPLSFAAALSRCRTNGA
jgi:hypothetical protein